MISIHAPLRERRQVLFQRHPVTRFQSTLPCGSDTGQVAYAAAVVIFQSTLPCGSDILAPCAPDTLLGFQSTLPCGSDARDRISAAIVALISIHAPLRERHGVPVSAAVLIVYFNPRSLAGATRFTASPCNILLFQSTLPCGSDKVCLNFSVAIIYFNPRSLAGATCKLNHALVTNLISIHAPLRERLYLLSVYLY